MADPTFDPSKDGNAVELTDRNLTSKTADPKSQSGGNNAGNAHDDDKITPVVEETKAAEENTAAAGTTTNERPPSERVASVRAPSDVDEEEHRDPWKTPGFYMALVTLGVLWASAQAPLFLFAAIPVYLYSDLGGQDHWAWLASAHLIAIAAVSPFVGSLSDKFGRRPVALAGSVFIIIGQVMCGLAPYMDVFIGGMVITGIGAGISELATLAGIADIVPATWRGYYTAWVILFSVLPLVPSVMWAQLIASHSTWRYLAILTGGLPVIGLALTFVFYFPSAPPGIDRTKGFSEMMSHTDLFGGFLTIAGLVLLNYGLLGGGYLRPWATAGTMIPIFAGVVLIGGFVAWEIRTSVRNPLYRWRVMHDRRTMLLTLLITFVSGANFFSVLMLWPGEAYNVYGHDPIGVGLRGLPFAAGTFFGCFMSLYFLSRFPHHVKWVLFGSSILMTAGCGGIAGARVDNIKAIISPLILAGLGVGGIVVPASVVSTYAGGNDAFATTMALTMAVRIVGGAIGYAVYFNNFVGRLIPLLKTYVGEACVKVGITEPGIIGDVIGLTGASLLDEIKNLPGIDEAKWEIIVAAGQRAYADAYPVVYYISIIFGFLAIVASLALGDIAHHLNDRIPAEYT